MLEEASLIQRRKSGRVNFLAIRRAGLHRVRDWALQYRSDWGTDEESLDNYIAAIQRGDQPKDPHPKE